MMRKAIPKKVRWESSFSRIGILFVLSYGGKTGSQVWFICVIVWYRGHTFVFNHSMLFLQEVSQKLLEKIVIQVDTPDHFKVQLCCKLTL